MNFIKNITYGFIGGTYGVTGLGIVDGSGQIFAIASVALGGAAMVSALIVRKQIIKRKELDKKIAIEMR
jgi:hypothetical protein